MTATLARRLLHLELVPPPPPTLPPGGDGWPLDEPPPPEWWYATPPPVRAYLLVIASNQGEDGEDEGELHSLLELLAEAGDAGVPLVAVQSVALWWEWCRLFAGGGLARCRQFWGTGPDGLHQAYQGRPAGLVALWHASGTRALPQPLLRLLAAG